MQELSKLFLNYKMFLQFDIIILIFLLNILFCLIQNYNNYVLFLPLVMVKPVTIAMIHFRSFISDTQTVHEWFDSGKGGESCLVPCAGSVFQVQHSCVLLSRYGIPLRNTSYTHIGLSQPLNSTESRDKCWPS